MIDPEIELTELRSRLTSISAIIGKMAADGRRLVELESDPAVRAKLKRMHLLMFDAFAWHQELESRRTRGGEGGQGGGQIVTIAEEEALKRGMNAPRGGTGGAGGGEVT